MGWRFIGSVFVFFRPPGRLGRREGPAPQCCGCDPGLEFPRTGPISPARRAVLPARKQAAVFFYTLFRRVCCTQSCTPHRCLETALAISTREVVPLSQARATRSELADQVQAGAEKMIPQNGESDVVIAIRRNNSVCP